MPPREHVDGFDTGTWSPNVTVANLSYGVVRPLAPVSFPGIACGTSPTTAPTPPCVDVIPDAPVRVAKSWSVISGLCSAIVHLSTLILLAFIVIPMQRRDAHELRLAVADLQTVDLETVSFSLPVEDLDISDPLDSTIRQPDMVSMSIEDPSLASALEGANGHRGNSLGLEVLAPASSAASSSVNRASPGGQKPYGRSSPSGNSEFFGVTADGDKFVYVLDISTSMARRSQYGKTRYQIAAEELVRSVGNLSEKQQFFVILFSYRTRFLFDNSVSHARMVPATLANKRLLRGWLSRVQLAPGTDPRLGVMTGLRMRPSAVFLLSDGEFNGRKKNLQALPGNPPVEQIVASHRRGNTPIHTIALEDKRNRKRLRRLAQATGGGHRFVSREADFDVLMEDLTSKDPEDVLYAVQCIFKRGNTLGRLQQCDAAPVLINFLATGNVQLRVLVHRALLTLSEGEDFGPEGMQPTEEEIKDAQQRWASYWRKVANPELEVRADTDPISSDVL